MPEPLPQRLLSSIKCSWFHERFKSIRHDDPLRLWNLSRLGAKPFRDAVVDGGSFVFRVGQNFLYSMVTPSLSIKERCASLIKFGGDASERLVLRCEQPIDFPDPKDLVCRAGYENYLSVAMLFCSPAESFCLGIPSAETSIRRKP